MNYLKSYKLFESLDDAGCRIYDVGPDIEYSTLKSSERKSKYKSEILPELEDILIDIKDDEFDYKTSFSEADGPLDYDSINIRIFKINYPGPHKSFYLNEVKEKILHLDSFLRSENYFLSKDSSYYTTYANPYARRALSNNTIGIREFSFKDVKFKLDRINLTFYNSKR